MLLNDPSKCYYTWKKKRVKGVIKKEVWKTHSTKGSHGLDDTGNNYKNPFNPPTHQEEKEAFGKSSSYVSLKPTQVPMFAFFILFTINLKQ